MAHRTYKPSDLPLFVLVQVRDCLENQRVLAAVGMIRKNLDCGLHEANELRKIIQYEMDADALAERKKR